MPAKRTVERNMIFEVVRAFKKLRENTSMQWTVKDGESLISIDGKRY